MQTPSPWPTSCIASSTGFPAEHPDIQIDVAYEQTGFTRHVLGWYQTSALLAGLLAFRALFCLLADYRQPAVVGARLAIRIGLLVNTVTIVVENVHPRQEEGQPPAAAARAAAVQLTLTQIKVQIHTPRHTTIAGDPYSATASTQHSAQPPTQTDCPMNNDLFHVNSAAPATRPRPAREHSLAPNRRSPPRCHPTAPPGSTIRAFTSGRSGAIVGPQPYAEQTTPSPRIHS